MEGRQRWDQPSNEAHRGLSLAPQLPQDGKESLKSKTISASLPGLSGPVVQVADQVWQGLEAPLGAPAAAGRG